MSDLRALVLTPDGEVEEKWFPSTGQGFLNALYGVINCDEVEAVRLGKHGHYATMYVDMNNAIPIPNEFATIIVGGFNHAVYQMYTGTAIFLGVPDPLGDDTSLSRAADIYIRAVLFETKRGLITIRSLRERRF